MESSRSNRNRIDRACRAARVLIFGILRLIGDSKKFYADSAPRTRPLKNAQTVWFPGVVFRRDAAAALRALSFQRGAELTRIEIGRAVGALAHHFEIEPCRGDKRVLGERAAGLLRVDCELGEGRALRQEPVERR